MAKTTFYTPNLLALMPAISDDSIISRTVYSDDHLKAVLFGFAAGQELSEHTSAYPAVLHFLAGEATITLGEERQTAGPGAWVHMPARLPHTVQAQTAVVMLLLLLKQPASGK